LSDSVQVDEVATAAELTYGGAATVVDFSPGQLATPESQEMIVEYLVSTMVEVLAEAATKQRPLRPAKRIEVRILRRGLFFVRMKRLRRSNERGYTRRALGRRDEIGD
jgi:hypothetical protein